MTSIHTRGFAAFIIAVLLTASALFLVMRPASSITVYADFTQADGMFVGSNVAVLGVNLGKVEKLETRGDHVRLELSMPADTQIPAAAEAWVMSPNVVSDQYIELTPPYRGGATLADGAVIPVERTHSPIKWDKLVKSVNELLVTFGPEGANSDGSLGRVIGNAAKMLDGRGKDVRDAIRDISQASDVVNGEMPNVESLLKSLDLLVKVLADNKSTVDSLTTSVDDVAGEFAEQEGNIADAIASLSSVMDEVGRLVKKHGKSMTANVKGLADVSVELARHQRQLVEIMDTFPLGAENITRAISDDDKLRVRLDFSTNLSQSDRGKQLCQGLPIPQLCGGPGLTNPVPLPPDQPLGLLGGGN
ncbi:MAG: MCE family protein [Actinophytocola sp.]|nr:MCE family protein [Actinophytocola sp.]